MKKYIRINIANNAPISINHFKKAIDNASINLKSRYHTDIKIVNYEDYSLDIVIYSSNDITNIGKRLKGISSFLLKTYPEYKDFRVGTRLLIFCDVTSIYETKEKEDLNKIDPYFIIHNVVSLFEDPKSLDNRSKINKIYKILMEK